MYCMYSMSSFVWRFLTSLDNDRGISFHPSSYRLHVDTHCEISGGIVANSGTENLQL